MKSKGFLENNLLLTLCRYFERQFDLAEETGLPMFLHSRAASEDMLTLLKKHRNRFKGGVVSEVYLHRFKFEQNIYWY